MGRQMIVSLCKFQLLLITVLVLLVVATVTAPARAGSNISVVSNPVQGNPYEVNEYQDSTLTYNLTYSVGPNSEGVTPSVNSITVTFTVNNGGTIKESGSSTWTETLTQNLYSPMGLSCEASGPSDGFYSVTCKATLNLSDGTSFSSNTASDTFLVAQMTVNVSGPPYVIIDNGPGSTYGKPPYYNPPPNVDSTYTVYATGGSGHYTWNWSVSSNIAFDESYPTDNPVNVYGEVPTGPGTISCTATDTNTGSKQTGHRHPDVHDEYVTVWNSETDGPSGGAPALVGPQVQALAGKGATVTVEAGSSVSVEIGGSISGGIPETDFGLDLSVSQTTETDTGASTNIDCPPNAQLTLWNGALVPMVLTLYGTGQQWGPVGIVNTDAITKWKAAPPFADAWDYNSSELSSPAPTVSINPVQPW